MTPLVIVALMALLPVILLMVLRSNAAIVFLSLCLGSVLVQFVSDDATTFLQVFSTGSVISSNVISLVLLLVPAVLTTIFMVHTVRGTGLIINIFPALAVGIVGVLLAVPLCMPGLRYAITGTSLWHYLQNLQVMVVLASTVISLAFLWLQRPHRTGHNHKR